MAGYVKIYRQITETSIWETDEPYDRRSAWIDLLIMANYKDNPFSKVKRGQVCKSVVQLSERWHWCRNKTIAYLNALENEGMIRRKSTGKGTRIDIVKYQYYQGFDKVSEQLNEQPDEQLNEQLNEQPDEQLNEHTKRKDNKGKKEKKDLLVSSETNCQSDDRHGDVRSVIDAWNAIPWTNNVTRISSTSERGKSLKSRLKEYSLEDVLKAIENASESEFLKGAKWFSFEWLVKPNNFIKVFEGQYNEGRDSPDHQKGFDEMASKWLVIKERWGGETKDAGHLFWDICTDGAEMKADAVADYRQALWRADSLIGEVDEKETGGDLGQWLIKTSLRLGLKKRSSDAS